MLTHVVVGPTTVYALVGRAGPLPSWLPGLLVWWLLAHCWSGLGPGVAGFRSWGRGDDIRCYFYGHLLHIVLQLETLQLDIYLV